MVPALILSSDSHVFEPPDLWTTRIDAAFRDRAPRIQRIDGADQLVVEADQVISGIGLISNAGARFEAAEGFGMCSNEGECEAVCPKEIPISNIARMNRDYVKALWKAAP